MQPVQQASAEVFASYRSKSLHLEFKMKANEIFAEHVLSDSPMIKCYPFAPSCFNLQGVPPESQANQVETIQWLLRNRFIPSIQNQQVVFTSSENRGVNSAPSLKQQASSLQSRHHELKSENEYVQQLEEAEKEKAYLRMVEALEGLGQVYFLKGLLVLACKVFNAAIVLNDTYAQDASFKQLLLEALVKVEAAFINKNAGKPHTFSKGIEKILGYRKRLVGLRNLPRSDSDSMQEVFAAVTASRIRLTQDLVSDCIAHLGPPPCSYALVSMGSMSRCEASHFSDLEFAILLATDSPSLREYFRRLTRLLELKIINLGETEFPVLNHGQESPTPSGFCLDSGGNSPLGKEGLFELIGTPEQLARFLTPDWFAQDLIMSNAMSNLDMIMGDQALLTAYEKSAQGILDQPLVEKKVSLKAREHRALALLRGDILEFAPQLDKKKELSKVFDIKKELYRLPNSMLNALAVFYNLKSKNSWQRIAELCQRGLLSQEGAKHLTWAINEITRFRLATHLHYGSENEKVFYQPQSNYEVYQWKVGNYYVLQKKDLGLIAEIFQVILPLYEAIKKFCDTYGQVNLFKTHSLKEQSLLAQAEALWQANSREEAKEMCKKVIALDPTNAKALIMLGETLFSLSLLEEAADYFYKALSEFERLFVEGGAKLEQRLVFDYMMILKYLGCSLQQKPDEALRWFQKALFIYQKYEVNDKLKLASLYTGMSVSLIQKDRVQEALEYLEKAKQIFTACKDESVEETPSISKELSSVLNNLAFLYINRQDYLKAIDYFEQAIQVGGTGRGVRLTSLGSALHKAGRIEEGIATLKKALEVGKKTFGNVHPDVATTLSYLGMAYRDLPDYKNAQTCFKQELHLNQMFYGFWHESNSLRWHRLADTAKENGIYVEELIYRRSALEVERRSFGSKSLELKNTYVKICIAEKRLNHHAASIEAIEQALALYEAHHGKKSKEYAALLSYLLIAIGDTDPKRSVCVGLESLNVARECYPSPSEEEGMCLLNLGGLYEISDKKQALLYYHNSHEMFRQVLGLSHPTTQKALQRMRELDPQATKEWDEREKTLQDITKACLMLPASLRSGLPQQSSLTQAEEIEIILRLTKARMAPDQQLAVSELVQLINKFPGDPRGYFELGDIYKEQEMFESAQKLFNRFLTHAPENAEAHYQMGLVLSLQKQPQQAYLSLQKCLELDPGHEGTLQLLEQLNQTGLRQGMMPAERDLEIMTKVSTGSNDIFYQLHQEIKDGKVAKLQELYPFDLNHTDERGFSFLHYAAIRANFEAMVFLCEKGANIDLADKEGASPIFYVCSPNRMQFFDYLFERKARLDFQCKTNGVTCFHQCVLEGNTQALSRILDKQLFSVATMTGQGMTPLYLACQQGHIETVQLLIRRGADVNTKNVSGWAPIHIAAGQGYLALTALLLEQHADPTVTVEKKNAFFLALQTGQLETMRELVRHSPSLLLTKDERGYPPLFSSIVYRQNHLVPPLIELGAQTEEKWEDQTCLEYAIIEGLLEAVNILAQHLTAKEVRQGIFCGVAVKHDAILDILLEREADIAALVNTYTGIDVPILIYAAGCGTPHAVKKLLEKGANVLVTVQGDNVLHTAIRGDNDKVVEFLIREKKVPLDVLTEDERQATALALAVGAAKISYVQLLVEHGADINCSVTEYEVTPMHLALRSKQPLEIVQILLNSEHPYLNLQSKDEMTPVDLAATLGQQGILGLLLRAIFNQGTEKAQELLSHNTCVKVNLEGPSEESPPVNNHQGSLEVFQPETRKGKKKKKCVIQ